MFLAPLAQSAERLHGKENSVNAVLGSVIRGHAAANPPKELLKSGTRLPHSFVPRTQLHRRGAF
jgi:hypothetical protein